MEVRLSVHWVLAQVCLTVGPVGLWVHFVVISPFPACIIDIDILYYSLYSRIYSICSSSWENTYICSVIHGVRAIMVGKAKWKPLELALSMKVGHQQQHWTPRSAAEISTATEDLKDAGDNSHHIPIQLAYLGCAEDRSWRTTVDYHKLSQAVTPTVALVPDVFL